MSSKAKKTRKVRVPKIRLTDNANENTKLVLSDGLVLVEAGFARMARVLNGKSTRNVVVKDDKGNVVLDENGEPKMEKVEYALERPSEARIQYYEDKIAAQHEALFSQLRAGVRSQIITDAIPD